MSSEMSKPSVKWCVNHNTPKQKGTIVSSQITFIVLSLVQVIKLSLGNISHPMTLTYAMSKINLQLKLSIIY